MRYQAEFLIDWNIHFTIELKLVNLKQLITARGPVFIFVDVPSETIYWKMEHTWWLVRSR